jgi:hypothetical protein
MKGKLNIAFENGEVLIEGDREGLRYLAMICERLCHLTDEEAKTPSNRFHLSENMGSALKGSLPAVIRHIEE